MAYDSRRRRFFFLSPERAAFALLAAFFAPFDAAALGGMFDVCECNEVAPTDRIVFICGRGVSRSREEHYARRSGAHNEARVTELLRACHRKAADLFVGHFISFSTRDEAHVRKCLDEEREAK